MHPRIHLLTSTVIATALYRRCGVRVLWLFSAGVLADLDHIAWHTAWSGRLEPSAAWLHFAGDGREPRPTGVLPLHSWRLILGLLAVTLPGAQNGWRAPARLVAGGLALHRLMDDLDDAVGPWWRGRAARRRRALHAALFRRAGYRCEGCGAASVPLQAHHRLQREQGGKDRLDNLVALCRPCHDRAHGREPSREPSGTQASKP